MTDHWMAFIYRTDREERAQSIGIDEAQHEEDRLLEAADFNCASSTHATRESAEATARGMLRKLAAVDAGVPWAACVANPRTGIGTGSGKCYRVE